MNVKKSAKTNQWKSNFRNHGYSPRGGELRSESEDRRLMTGLMTGTATRTGDVELRWGVGEEEGAMVSSGRGELEGKVNTWPPWRAGGAVGGGDQHLACLWGETGGEVVMETGRLWCRTLRKVTWRPLKWKKKIYKPICGIIIILILQFSQILFKMPSIIWGKPLVLS